MGLQCCCGAVAMPLTGAAVEHMVPAIARVDILTVSCRIQIGPVTASSCRQSLPLRDVGAWACAERVHIVPFAEAKCLGRSCAAYSVGLCRTGSQKNFAYSRVRCLHAARSERYDYAWVEGEEQGVHLQHKAAYQSRHQDIHPASLVAHHSSVA